MMFSNCVCGFTSDPRIVVTLRAACWRHTMRLEFASSLASPAPLFRRLSNSRLSNDAPNRLTNCLSNRLSNGLSRHSKYSNR